MKIKTVACFKLKAAAEVLRDLIKCPDNDPGSTRKMQQVETLLRSWVEVFGQSAQEEEDDQEEKEEGDDSA